MEILSTFDKKVCASGKAILIGEHSVVYGECAIALALPDVQLQMELKSLKETKNISDSWENAWITVVQDKEIYPELNVRKLLCIAFEKALNLCGIEKKLSMFQASKIYINSQIPLGGGMGGSAAISTCLLKISMAISIENNIKDIEYFSFDKQIEMANEIDTLFHSGKASGLDVTAVASNGIIEFFKGKKPKTITNGKEFWLALIDSEERKETALMVQLVAELMRHHPEKALNAIKNLGILAKSSVKFIQQGNVEELANNLNKAQEHLEVLGVSTQKISLIINQLKKSGALAAKLTGAGGGGLILGLFEKKPEQLYDLFDRKNLFITRVPKNEQFASELS